MKLKVLITSPKRKEKLVNAFVECGATVITQLESNTDLIVPTVDEELPFFASAKEYFRQQGITVMISDPKTVDTCRDKAEFYRTCKRLGALCPATMQADIVIKPRFGKGSKDVKFIDRSSIIQEYIPFQEYSIDYLADMDSRPVSVMCRTREQIVNGESTAGTIDNKPFIVDEVMRFARLLNLKGHNTVQGWSTGKTFIFNEINCRFGGGFWISRPTFDTVAWIVNNF